MRSQLSTPVGIVFVSDCVTLFPLGHPKNCFLSAGLPKKSGQLGDRDFFFNFMFLLT